MGRCDHGLSRHGSAGLRDGPHGVLGPRPAGLRPRQTRDCAQSRHLRGGGSGERHRSDGWPGRTGAQDRRRLVLSRLRGHQHRREPGRARSADPRAAAERARSPPGGGMMMAAWREALSDPARCRELWRQYGSINGVARAVGCSYHTAKRYLAQAGIYPGMRTDGGEKPPVELEPEQPRISVTKEGDTEVFLIDGVSYRIPLATKRQVYALCSRDGGNVQVADIELEFGIPRAAFEAIKRYWGLTHSSLMWPDEDIAERDPDELVEEGLANRKRLLHRRFKARERSWYKEQYEKLAQRASLEDRLIEVARDVLPAWTPPRVIVPYRRADARRRLLI